MATVESPLPDPPRDGLGWRFLIIALLLATGMAGIFATVQARSQFPIPQAPATTSPAPARPAPLP
jgi:hypothetical protein